MQNVGNPFVRHNTAPLFKRQTHDESLTLWFGCTVKKIFAQMNSELNLGGIDSKLK